MKPLKLWSMSILIALALPLSAANSANGSDATPSNQPHRSQIEQTPAGQHAYPPPTAALRNQGGSAPTSTQTAAYTYNYYYPAPESWLAIIGQIAAIMSAVLLTIFTGGLWWTSIRQWQAMLRQGGTLDSTLIETAKAANAAKESADAAVAASAAHLHLMRLWLEGNEGRGKDIMDGMVGVADPVLHYGFTNYGKTPAFLLEMCVCGCRRTGPRPSISVEPPFQQISS